MSLFSAIKSSPSAAALSLGLLAVVSGFLVFYFATHPAEISLLDGEYLPWGYDSFYLAALIREVVESYPAIIEHDDRLHPNPADGPAPITFTWAYIGLIATLIKGVQLVLPGLSVSTIQAFLPPLWGALSCLVFIGLCRRAGLSYLATVFGALGFALAPFVRERHLLGNIDHHFMEMFFLLLIMFTFLGWVNKPRSRNTAILAGAALGISVAFHFALFITYLPIAAFMAIQWLRGQLDGGSQYRAFLISVLLATTIAVLPTTHLRNFDFSYYYLGWFHLYWSMSFCAVAWFMYWRSYSPARLAGLVVGLAVLAILPINNLLHGADFLAAQLPGFAQIWETQPVFSLLVSGDGHLFKLVYDYYTGLLLLAPVVFAMLLRQAWVRPDARLIYLLCACLFGFVLLLIQLRFSYHAPYALLIPALLLLDFRLQNYRYGGAVIAGVFALCYFGAVTTLTHAKPLGGIEGYQRLLPVYRVIGEQCEKHPGVLLAYPDEGHFLRYHTDCQLVSSNMLASARDFEYRALAFEMLGMSGSELVQKYDWIDYVYLRREDGGNDPASAREVNRGLRAEVLLDQILQPGARSIAVSQDNRGLYIAFLQMHQRW